MGAMFGHTWSSQFGTKPEGLGGDTWAAALSGVTAQQLAHGLRETLTLGGEFPPSAPKFRAMCLGIPSLAHVRTEILARDSRRSPFARLTLSNIDTFRFRMADADKADYLIRDAYELAREHVMRGGELPEEVTGEIEAPKPEPIKPATPEKVQAVMRDLTAVLGEEVPSQEPDRRTAAAGPDA